VGEEGRKKKEKGQRTPETPFYGVWAHYSNPNEILPSPIFVGGEERGRGGEWEKEKNKNAFIKVAFWLGRNALSLAVY